MELEIAAVMSVVDSISDELSKEKEKRIAINILNQVNLGVDEKTRVIATLMDQALQLDEKYEIEKERNKSSFRAKLEAKKRVRDLRKMDEVRNKEISTSTGPIVRSFCVFV